MKITIITILLLTTIFGGFSQTIDSTQAYQIAANFFAHSKKSSHIQAFNQSSKKSLSSKKVVNSKTGNPALYIFNSTDEGFVIVSGNSKSKPVLAYSLKGNLDLNDMPPALQRWISVKENEINALVQNTSITGSTNTTGTTESATNTSYTFSDPLVKTNWGQGVYYNNNCPVDSQSVFSNSKVPVGCVATAMSQILKYWEYPTHGTGVHSYNHPVYGTQSVSFETTQYNWDSMPTVVNGVNPDVASLAYQCGVSVDMNYAPFNSTTYLDLVNNALVNYFGYKSTLTQVNHSNFNNDGWNALLKSEIDQFRPVLMRGASESGDNGHAYICDGYTSDNYFHINWGWDGRFDGYFLLDNLNPGNANFSNNQYAIIGIQPGSNSCAVYPGVLTLEPDSNISGNVRIVTNSDWTAEVSQPWVVLNKYSGSGSGNLVISTIAINNTDSDRIAYIQIHVSGVETKTIVVKQLTNKIINQNFSFVSLSNDSDFLKFSVNLNSSLVSSITCEDTVIIHFGINNTSELFNGSLSYAILVDNKLVKQNVTGYINSKGNFEVIDTVGVFSIGTHQISLVLDPNNVIEETNENDNVLISSFLVIRGNTPFIAVSNSKFELNYNTTHIDFSVESNTNWKLSSDVDWILIDSTNYNGNTDLSIQVNENSGIENRVGKLFISTESGDTAMINVNQTFGTANLAPYKPSSWRDKLIISNKKNTLYDATIFNTDTVYIDYSFINNGVKKTSNAFSYALYLDDSLLFEYTKAETLKPGSYIYAKDYKVNPLKAGLHTLKLVLDSKNEITESNETDNIYSKTFEVSISESVIEVYPKVINISDITGDTKIDVNATGSWNLINNTSWIHVNYSSGAGNAQVSFSIDDNSDDMERTGSIIFTNDISSEEVIIYQSAKKTSGVNNILINNIKVYPNPATDFVSFTYGSQKSTLKVSIFDLTGKCVANQVVENEQKMDVRNLKTGTYIYKLSSGTQTVNGKFVKE